jgi:hypothetical protein
VFGGDGNDVVAVLGARAEGHGSAGNDTITAIDGTAFGGPGDDRLSGESGADLRGGIGNDFIEALAGSTGSGEAGNDVLRIFGTSTGYGGDGDDQMSVGSNTGRDYGDEADGLSLAYGGAGNDTITAFGLAKAYGGDGADNIDIVADYNASDGTPDSRPRAYVLGASVEGGAGNDVIVDRSTPVRADRGDTFNIIDQLHVDAGSGDDTVSLFNALRVDLGAGNDVLIVSTPELADAFDTGTATLGAGADRVVIAPTGIDAITQVLTDFNPAEDRLGLIIPQASSGSVTMTSVFDAPSQSTVVTINTGDGSANNLITLRLQGVSTAVTPAMIALYADDAAALAGTSYDTL